MTTEQFAAYDAIVVSDQSCNSDDDADRSAAVANAAVWSAALTGNVFVTTLDAAYHAESGANQAGADATLTAAIRYTLASPGTGAYLSISCGDTSDVDLFSALSTGGSFVATGGGGDDVNIVAAPAPTELAGLSNSDLSNWGSSWHMSFTSIPADFSTFAVAVDGGGNGVAVTRSGSATTRANRVGYCAVAGNTRPSGAAIAPGTFLDLISGQPQSDPHYKGALAASFYQGLGLSCDALPGYTKTGEMVGYGGSGSSGPYTYMKKN